VKKILSGTAVMLSLGLMAAFGNAFGQGEIKTAAAMPDAAKGSVEVEVKVKEYTIEMTTSVGGRSDDFQGNEHGQGNPRL